MKKQCFILVLLLFIPASTIAPPTKQPVNKEQQMFYHFTLQVRQVLRKAEQKEFNKFLNALSHKESSGDHTIINELGAIGKYQFMPNTLRHLGYKQYINKPHEFTPKLQDKAVIELMKSNKQILSKEIKQYCGTFINEVYITESGLLAAAHLGGAFGVKKYLKTNGAYNPHDINGTHLTDYIKLFSGYQLHFHEYKPLR